MEDLECKVEEWIQSKFKNPISGLGQSKYEVMVADDKILDWVSIWILKYKASVIIVAREEWVNDLKELIKVTDKDMLFSIYGTFELGRVTLPDGVNIMGPSYYLFGDKEKCKLDLDKRVFMPNKEELASVDKDIFWHCYLDSPVSAFAVESEGKIAALATVTNKGENVYEIGMEVERSAQGSGMGRAVVNGAAQWILEMGGTPLATVGSFNVPSARTLRSVGLTYYLTDMVGSTGDFVVPPQALGTPIKDVDIYNLYHDWAMNPKIKSKK